MATRDTIFAAEQALRGDLDGWLHDHTEQEGECMIWQGGFSNGSVPCMRLPKALPPKAGRGSAASVRVVIWEEINKRKLKAGHVTWPSCGNHECINPAHLKSGTRKESYRSLRASGRHVLPFEAIAKNAEIRRSKSTVTWSAVHQLRADYMATPAQRYGFHNRDTGLIRPSRTDLIEDFAKEYNISAEAAWRIARGQTWKAETNLSNPFSQLLMAA